MKMETTCKLMTLIKKVMQLKDDQYIEDLTFQVMEEIDKQNEPGWKARYESKRSTKNYRVHDPHLQDAWPILQPASMGMPNRLQAAQS